MGDFWRANHGRGKAGAQTLPGLSRAKRGGHGAGRATGAVSVHEACTSACQLSAAPLADPPALPSQMAEQLMTLAYDNGINLFDTAEVYAAGKYVPCFGGGTRGLALRPGLWHPRAAAALGVSRVWRLPGWGCERLLGGRWLVRPRAARATQLLPPKHFISVAGSWCPLLL